MSPDAAKRLGRWSTHVAGQGRNMTDDEFAAWEQGKEPPAFVSVSVVDQVGQLDNRPVCTLDAARMRTIAVQAIQRENLDQVQCQETIVSDDLSRAHGFVRLRDGRLYVVRVELWHKEETT